MLTKLLVCYQKVQLPEVLLKKWTCKRPICNVFVIDGLIKFVYFLQKGKKNKKIVLSF